MSLEDFTAAVRARHFPLPQTGQWVGGQWTKDKRAQIVGQSLNPSTGEKLIDIAISGFVVETAISAGVDAESALQSMSFEDRFVVLSRFKQVAADYSDDIIEVLRVEVGKPRWEAEVDFHAALGRLDRVLQEKDQILDALTGPFRLGNHVAHLDLKPIGLCASFVPFSNPFETVMQGFSNCLISGCPILFMASGHATLSGILMAYLLENLELPKGSVQMLFGNYKTFAKGLQDRRIKAVIYSGSREHCDTIRRDNVVDLTRQLLLQSGGKNSVFVHPSADCKEAVRIALLGAIKTAGQLNSSTSRIIVPDSMRKEFSELLAESVRNLPIGRTDLEGDPMMGPLYSQKAVDKFLRFQTMAKREAADTLVWGKALDRDTDGFFVLPAVHVFNDFDPNSSYQSNVFMCPDMVIYSYSEIDEGIRIANETNAPFVTSVVSDPDGLESVRLKLQAPNILHNLPTVGVDSHFPVSGRNLCGAFRFSGMSMSLLLTFPQAQQGNDELASLFAKWPELP